MLCFKFIFTYHEKYVSTEPVCAYYTASSHHYATEEENVIPHICLT